VVEDTGPQGEGLVLFQATVPTNWTRGEGYTFSLSFHGDPISGSGNAYMNYVGFGFYLSQAPNGIYLPALLTQEYPATITVSFANGGSATEQFIIAPVPEPATWAFLVTGLLFIVSQRGNLVRRKA
jgi:hypothetical protein